MFPHIVVSLPLGLTGNGAIESLTGITSFHSTTSSKD